MKRKLANALAALRKANRKVEFTLREQYPVGEPVQWAVGDHVQHGEVVSHAYGDRFKVFNHETGRESWLYAYRIL